MHKPLTNEQYREAVAFTKTVAKSQVYKHNKTGRLVRVAWEEIQCEFPHICVEGLKKQEGASHIRRTTIQALNFKRDYTRQPEMEGFNGPLP